MTPTFNFFLFRKIILFSSLNSFRGLALLSPCELTHSFIRKSLPRFQEYLHLQLERTSFEPVFRGLRVPYQRCNMFLPMSRPPFERVSRSPLPSAAFQSQMRRAVLFQLKVSRFSHWSKLTNERETHSSSPHVDTRSTSCHHVPLDPTPAHTDRSEHR